MARLGISKGKKKRAAWLHMEVNLFVDHKQSTEGFALMSVTILLGILLAFSFVLLNSSMNTRFVGNVFQQALSAEQLAEAGLHKALFCLKATSGTNCGGTYGTSYAGESNVAFGNGTFTTTVTGSSSTKTVTSVGTSVTGQTKTVKSDLVTSAVTTSMTMAAAVQAGSNGIDMSNNVTVIGDGDANNTVTDSDVTSVGDVICGANAKISGNVAVTRTGGKVDNCTITKNAYADLLTNDKITLNAYYLTAITGIAGSTVTGTKFPGSTTPSPVAMPNLDIAGWEALAAAGTVYTGNYNVTGTTTHIGPMKIIGNLTAANSTTLTLDGPVYVTGTVDINNNGTVKLNSTMGASSGIMIADGKIRINNNGIIQGSGTSGSVIVMVSNSTAITSASAAIQVDNNAAGAVLYAPNGAVHTSNNADVPAVAGLKVIMDNNTTVNLGGLNVFGAPINVSTGGSTVDWHLKTDSWREFK